MRLRVSSVAQYNFMVGLGSATLGNAVVVRIVDISDDIPWNSLSGVDIYELPSHVVCEDSVEARHISVVCDIE